MKIKDLPGNSSLEGVRFIYPGDGGTYYWRSQWCKGVWARKEPAEQRIWPLAVDDLKETLEWDIVDETKNEDEDAGKH